MPEANVGFQGTCDLPFPVDMLASFIGEREPADRLGFHEGIPFRAGFLFRKGTGKTV